MKYPPITQAYGETLMVWRRKGAAQDANPGRYGTLETNTHEPHHEITCGFTETSSGDAGDEHQSTARRTFVLTAPPGTDILSDDQVMCPDGLLASVEGKPYTPKNQFTGWEPRVKISLVRERFDNQSEEA